MAKRQGCYRAKPPWSTYFCLLIAITDLLETQSNCTRLTMSAHTPYHGAGPHLGPLRRTLDRVLYQPHPDKLLILHFDPKYQISLDFF